MEFGLDKCVKAIFFCGKLLKAKNITLDTTTVIKDLEPQKSYKYLSATDGDEIHFSMREKNSEKMFLQGEVNPEK